MCRPIKYVAKTLLRMPSTGNIGSSGITVDQSQSMYGELVVHVRTRGTCNMGVGS